MAAHLEFNADLGEGLGVWAAPMQVWRADLERGGPLDPVDGTPASSLSAVLKSISAVSLACGFHAGDPYLIKRYIAAAKQAGCTIGAHPSYPDLAGFGLRYMELAPAEIEAIVQYQVAALDGLLRVEGIELHHVKCHGALYNRAAKDPIVASAVAAAVAAFRRDLPLYGLPGSCLEEAAIHLGIPFLREAFADRAYHQDGSLVDRRRSDAMILDADAVAQRVLRMAQSGTIVTIEGAELSLDPQTICFHSDTPNVFDFLEKSRRALESAGVRLIGREIEDPSQS
ncbi:MAG TPA: 5-oxoprolinase subunit PxpA [Gemmatimonadales bacterium]|nr:5-oxoprolinase subunit PxpA [Gemmatimonadales bacterium]